MTLSTRDKTPTALQLPGLKAKAYKIAFDSSYPTGGEAWDLSDDFDVIFGAVIEPKNGYTFELTSQDSPADSKVKAYTPAGMLKRDLVQGGAAGNFSVDGVVASDEIVAVIATNTISDDTSNTQQVADLVDLTAEFTVEATSTISNDGGTATASTEELLVLFTKAAQQEVANTKDLSAVTDVGVLVWGRKY